MGAYCIGQVLSPSQGTQGGEEGHAQGGERDPHCDQELVALQPSPSVGTQP